MTLKVVEIIGRSEQGFTKPYICRCDDGEVYFVKGRSATRRGLINEWLCANLAEAFGLPIAPFALAEVPQELIEADLTGWLKGLGAGAVFAAPARLPTRSSALPRQIASTAGQAVYRRH